MIFDEYIIDLRLHLFTSGRYIIQYVNASLSEKVQLNLRIYLNILITVIRQDEIVTDYNTVYDSITLLWPSYDRLKSSNHNVLFPLN